MIKDPLYRDILTRLGEPLDPDAFERAVPDLLRPQFGLVVPLPGGSDAGFDAAVVDGEGEPFPVVCTTGEDVLGNLRRSLTANLAARFLRRKAVLATSQHLSNQRKRNLFAEARKLGFQLIDIIDRDQLAYLLYHLPRARLDLLDLGGEPRPLAAVPGPGRYPVRPTLIARDQDLEWLESTKGDRLLVGVPGSGKTALAAMLVETGKALFVRPHATPGTILDACREQSPAVLVVDDAHVELELLTALRTARQDAKQRFEILATTWPGQQEEVADALGIDQPAAARCLELLTRDEILALYRELGVEARPNVMRELVDQAANRPGLAVTLAMLWKRAAWEEIVRGRALDAYARRALRAVVGSRSGVEVLAAFSLGGSRGVSLEAVSEALEAPKAEVRQLAVSLGAAGVIDERGRNALAVQPMQLRSALLAEVYFSGRATDLDFLPLLNRVENRTSAVEGVIYALLRGGKLPEDVARAIVSSVENARPWTLYAHLGPTQARWVLDNYPGTLVEIARAVLEKAAGPALDRLLAEAYPPPESLGSTPGHPLRIIRDWVRGFATAPRSVVVTTQLEKRSELSHAVVRYAAGGGRPEVVGPALYAVLDTNLESWEADAGSGRSVTVKADMAPVEVLERLGELWADLRTAFPALDRALWSSLRELLWDLAQPHIPFGKVVPEAERGAARALATRIVADLLPLATERPGLLRELGELGRELGVAFPAELDPIYELLFPRDPFSEPDHSRWAAAQREAISRLASEWSSEDPKVVVERLARYRREATDAGQTWPDNCPLLADELAARVRAPRAWLESLSNAGLGGELGGSFLSAMLRRREAGWEEDLRRGLESDVLAAAALELALIAADLPEDLRTAAVWRAKDFPKLVETLALTDRIPTPVLGDLLTRGGPVAALAAAVGHWIADPRGTVEPTVSSAWRDAILLARAREDGGHRLDSGLGYWLGDILESDSGLAADWLRAELEAAPPGGLFLLLETEPTWHAIRALRPEQRNDLIATGNLGRHSTSVLGLLVNDDPEVFRVLLDREDLSALHLAPLRRCPDAAWWALAGIAVEAGIGAEAVAHAAFELEMDGWSGSEAEHRRRWVEAFAAMTNAADPRLAEVAHIGEKEARARVADVVRRERAEAMRGSD